ncbi:venom serine protease 34 isoform X2 [Harpegnathos saltator]|uniref:venom serine protease 34 isoform X2 n=1 Tax=Harpegnathos saltator TaxID=610380 RepID=UPI000DBEDD25|nr:venom serine protease 34 isoform X2 [Harpegnathos saltator]
MKFKVVTFGLLLSFLTLSEAQSDCNYFQNMEPGESYYIYNPMYPNSYPRGSYCTWKANSPYTIKLNCEVNMSTSPGCNEDQLSIQFAGQDINSYCGTGSLELVGSNVIVYFKSSYYTQGGKFWCHLRSEKPLDDCRCGWKNPAPAIVGGKETGVNEFPMMAGLVDSVERILYCGATIISTQHVITAAHCVKDRDPGKLGVIVGEHDTSTGTETNATKLYRMKECMIHPGYFPGNTINQNDIAVCQIIGSITYNDKVSPVCLPFQHSRDSFDESIVTALGWGLKEFGGEKAVELHGVELDVINLSDCKRAYYGITDGHMCTYTPGKDACQMDSGGPAIWKNPITYNNVLVGIISSGVGCATDKPAVSTRVGRYIDWIQSVTPGVRYCQLE